MARYSPTRRTTLPALAAIVAFGLLAGASTVRPAAAAAASCPTISQEYKTVGASVLGRPIGKTLHIADRRGLYRRYQHGEIWWTKGTCAHALGGDILAKWKAAGGAGTLGYPTTDPRRSRSGPAALFSRFEHGEIYSFPTVLRAYLLEAAPVYAIRGAIYRRWAASGAEAGVLGYPTSDPLPAGNSSTVSRFSGGAIYSSPAGAYAVTGTIYLKYRALNETQGLLGYPTDEEQPAGSDGRSEVFENGMLVSSPRGVFEVHGAIYSNYGTDDLTGELGRPVSDVHDIIGGSTTAAASPKYRGPAEISVFEHGAIVATPNGGVYRVPDPLYTRWQRMGGVNGQLGLPTNGYSTAGGLGQQFQGGRLFATNLSNPEQTSSFCNAAGPGCDNASPPPVIGYSEYDVYNCTGDGHALTVWARDITAGTPFRAEPSIAPSIDSYGSCPAVFGPAQVKLAPAGHQFEIVAVDAQAPKCIANAPAEIDCQVWRDVVTSNTAGPVATVYAF
jgi:uncharacterized protein with LGFP repeats